MKRDLIRASLAGVVAFAILSLFSAWVAFGQVTPSNPRVRYPLAKTGNLISIQKATATKNGYLSSADFVTFSSGGGFSDPYTPPSGKFTVHGLEAFPDVAGAYPPSYGLTFGPAGDTQWQTFVGDAGTTLYNYTTGAANQYKWAYGGAVKMGLAPNAGGNVLTVVSPSGAADRIVIGGSTLRGDGSAAFNSAVISGTITMDSFTANAPSTVAAGQYLRNDTHLPSTAGGDIKFDDSDFNRLATMHDAGTTGDLIVTGALGVGGGAQVSKLPGVVTLTKGSVAAPGSATEGAAFKMPNVANATIDTCYVGHACDGLCSGVGTCTDDLYDKTASSVVGSCTYTCGTPGTNASCFTGGTLTAAHVYTLRITPGTTSASPDDTIVCDYTY